MKPFTTIASGVFAVVALMHLLRIVLAWPVLINGMVVPIWASVVGFVIAAVLAAMLWRERRIA
jgi:membrane protein implicated in regulation of membrane protease activity